MLLRLWREWHEGDPVQLQLPLGWTVEKVEAAPTKRVKRSRILIREHVDGDNAVNIALE